MKAKTKRQEATKLPRCVIGALAAVGSSSVNGATVQITFNNNIVDGWGGITYFSSDLTGDGIDDVVGRGVGTLKGGYANVSDDGVVLASAMIYGFVGLARKKAFVGEGSLYSNVLFGGDFVVRGVTPVTFSDLKVNGGRVTAGWLDMTAHARLRPDSFAKVQIHRLIFDEALTTAPTGVDYTDTAYPEWQVSAVPEPGSNLALLALGAGGLTLRRRLMRAA